ncbi:MAG: class I SAM-dependent methyltransferase [Planctomycetota bacterium]|nr:class I SAM-dependent methyltransferase [Planctomycetota bacterium]
MSLKHPFILKILDRISIGIPTQIQRLRGRPYLAAAVRRIAGLPAGTMPSREMLIALRRSWGNPGYSPSMDLLTATARLALETEGPILECGSGLTTLLLGLLTRPRAIPVWSLEHHPKWHARIRSVIRRHRLAHVTVCHTPLTDYGPFEWYAEPTSLLPDDFRLVICDGPPGMTRGGRYGLMPVMGRRLAEDCIILLDDSHRRREREALEAWMREQELTTTELGTGNCLTEISFNGAPRATNASPPLVAAPASTAS